MTREVVPLWGDSANRWGWSWISGDRRDGKDVWHYFVLGDALCGRFSLANNGGEFMKRDDSYMAICPECDKALNKEAPDA